MHSFFDSDDTVLTGSGNYENVKCYMVSLPGTSEKERTDCILRKSERGFFKFFHQTQTQETRIHKKGQPGRKVQVFLFTCRHPHHYFYLLSSSFYLFYFIFSFIILFSVPWSCHMSHPWKTNKERSLHPKLCTLWPTSQRRDLRRNRDVSVVSNPRRFCSFPRCQIGL